MIDFWFLLPRVGERRFSRIFFENVPLNII